MSTASIDSLSSCEVATSDYLKPINSEILSTKSEVICQYSFKELIPGSCFLISGVVLRTCERFSINFLAVSNKQDVALHFNPRLPQNYIVRNSKINGHWGSEETHSQFSSRYDLLRGHRFQVEFLITESEFIIAINNRLFGVFEHRINYKKLNAIEVKGDVKEVAIEQLFRDKYPDVPIPEIPLEEPSDDSIFPVPMLVNIPNGFTKNKSIHIIAKVKMLPHSITINLQSRPYFYPHAIIPLHINPRFGGGKHIICRNTWNHGKWGKEERTDISSKDLSPGRMFKMTIFCDFEFYHIFLNDYLFAEYRHRCETNIVDTLCIFGDIVLKKVWIETKSFD
ncbi:hypothetical protein PVAND_001387 [Polypedilum vanderplanki]|uniref:Galectin n=1 Tax=Polypedilum vanderplanki TaxID=319348 RepID=A0A9J6BN86_POLVA|nr:hypothetical protein PVAND_001387 [Polypedilum vanderplanki]